MMNHRLIIVVLITFSVLFVSSRTGVADDIWTWGDNSNGQLGDGTKNNIDCTPHIINFSNVKSVSGGLYHTIAITNDLNVFAWGFNNFGMLGDGTTNNSLYPIQVKGLSKVQAIASGNFHNLALTYDGIIYAWGDNSQGQLGNSTIGYSSTPIPVKGLPYITAIAAGGFHSIALDNDHNVWTWGANFRGQLGNGMKNKTHDFVQVRGLKVKEIAAGDAHTLALAMNGTVWAWGNGTVGQLGNGKNDDLSDPVQVIIPPIVDVETIGSGADHSFAITSEYGEVYAWGANSRGQLGNGQTKSENTPIKLTEISNVESITGGYSNTIAKGRDGTIWTWGDNSQGQLGLGNCTTQYETKPEKISNPPIATDVKSGRAHSIALTASILKSDNDHLHGVASQSWEEEISSRLHDSLQFLKENLWIFTIIGVICSIIIAIWGPGGKDRVSKITGFFKKGKQQKK